MRVSRHIHISEFRGKTPLASGVPSTHSSVQVSEVRGKATLHSRRRSRVFLLREEALHWRWWLPSSSSLRPRRRCVCQRASTSALRLACNVDFGHMGQPLKGRTMPTSSLRLSCNVDFGNMDVVVVAASFLEIWTTLKGTDGAAGGGADGRTLPKGRTDTSKGTDGAAAVVLLRSRCVCCRLEPTNTTSSTRRCCRRCFPVEFSCLA